MYIEGKIVLKLVKFQLCQKHQDHLNEKQKSCMQIYVQDVVQTQ